jgi:Mg-chelatase subunit ChlD
MSTDWRLADANERPAMDAARTAAHNAVIDALNILSRAMLKAGENTAWRKEIGDNRQDIASFTTERAPMSLVVPLDTSGSIASKLDKIRSAASTIIHQAGDQDEFCLVEFKTDVYVIQDFTSDASSADRALASLKAGGGTALLDSLKFALQYANQRASMSGKASCSLRTAARPTVTQPAPT